MRWHLLVQSQIKKTSSSWCSRRVKRNLTFLRKEKGGKILRMCDISRRPREIGPNFGNSQGAQKGKRMAYGSCLKTKPVCWKCEGPWDMAHILARHLAYNVPTTVSPKHTCTSSRVPFSVFFFLSIGCLRTPKRLRFWLQIWYARMWLLFGFFAHVFRLRYHEFGPVWTVDGEGYSTLILIVTSRSKSVFYRTE